MNCSFTIQNQFNVFAALNLISILCLLYLKYNCNILNLMLLYIHVKIISNPISPNQMVLLRYYGIKTIITPYD